MKNKINWNHIVIAMLLFLIVLLTHINSLYKDRINHRQDTVYILVDSLGNESVLEK